MRPLLVVSLSMLSGCSPTNFAEACDQLADSYCERRFVCTKDDDERSSCLRAVHASCCSGAVCTAPFTEVSAFSRCRVQLTTHSCTLLAQQVLPLDCEGVLAPPRATLGGVCGVAGETACDGDSRLLRCAGDSWSLVSECRGPRGCTPESCDASGNTAGDRCAPADEGVERCDPVTATNINQCRSGTWQVVLACPTPSRCVKNGAMFVCGA